MQPGSKASKCLAALAVGPRTTAEVGRATGLSTKLASAHLVGLMARGKVQRKKFVQITQPRRGRPDRWLWLAAAANDGEKGGEQNGRDAGRDGEVAGPAWGETG